MNKIWKSVLKGLGALLPTAVVIYILYWVVTSTERLFGSLIEKGIGEERYIPGTGLVIGVLSLIALGLIVNAWAVRRLLGLWERILQRLPVIKTLYSSVKDLTDFITASDKDTDLKKVVFVTLAGTRLIGFITSENPEYLPDVADNEDQSQDIVAVYLPMSYQVGGFTVFLPRNQVESTDLSSEEGMRLAFTAGLSRRPKEPVPEPKES